jgi:hypothetical protein
MSIKIPVRAERVVYHPFAKGGFALHTFQKDKSIFQLYDKNEKVIHEQITPLY